MQGPFWYNDNSMANRLVKTLICVCAVKSHPASLFHLFLFPKGFVICHSLLLQIYPSSESATTPFFFFFYQIV